MTFPETGTEEKNGDKPTCYGVTSQMTPGRALELVRNPGYVSAGTQGGSGVPPQ